MAHKISIGVSPETVSFKKRGSPGLEVSYEYALTAVNAMPEMERILRCVVDKVINNPLRISTFEDRCERLLKQLEAADGS